MLFENYKFEKFETKIIDIESPKGTFIDDIKINKEVIENLEKIDNVSFVNMGDYLSYNGDPPKRIQYFQVTTHGPRGNTQYRYDLEGKFTKKLQ